MKKNNRIIVDLHKVQYAIFYYKNQWQQTRPTLPRDKTWFSIRSISYSKNEPVFHHHAHPDENAWQRAMRLGMVDMWIPEVKLQLQANHSLVYTGDKARSIWKEWQRRQFKKK